MTSLWPGTRTSGTPCKTAAWPFHTALEVVVGRFNHLWTETVFMLNIKYAITDYDKSTFL